MEEQFKRESFYPEKGEDFFLISFLEAEALVLIENYDNGYKTDFDCGLAFKTRPEAEAKLAEMQAITKIRKFIFENDMEFDPYWENYRQEKWDIYYDIREKKFKSSWLSSFSQSPSIFGYFKSEEDCEKVIENCKDELDVIFKVKK